MKRCAISVMAEDVEPLRGKCRAQEPCVCTHGGAGILAPSSWRCGRASAKAATVFPASFYTLLAVLTVLEMLALCLSSYPLTGSKQPTYFPNVYAETG